MIKSVSDAVLDTVLDLRDFTLHALTEREEVAHIETRLIFEFRRNVELPARGDVPA